jgi:hypothetical protein
MKLNRIVELQAHTVIRKITDTQEEYEFVEGLIESRKPTLPKAKHHYLIKTPFRYFLPVQPRYASRFKPPFYERNCLYGTREFRTAVYEYGYHWLRQRVHVEGLSHEPQPRTCFKVGFKDTSIKDIRKHPKIKTLMDRDDYGPSHRFVLENPAVSSLLYPSCRDPRKGDCVVTFDINTLGLKPEDERTFHLIYEEKSKRCVFKDPLEDPSSKKAPISVSWSEVV